MGMLRVQHNAKVVRTRRSLRGCSKERVELNRYAVGGRAFQVGQTQTA